MFARKPSLREIITPVSVPFCCSFRLRSSGKEALKRSASISSGLIEVIRDGSSCGGFLMIVLLTFYPELGTNVPHFSGGKNVKKGSHRSTVSWFWLYTFFFAPLSQDPKIRLQTLRFHLADLYTLRLHFRITDFNGHEWRRI